MATPSPMVVRRRALRLVFATHLLLRLYFNFDPRFRKSLDDILGPPRDRYGSRLHISVTYRSRCRPGSPGGQRIGRAIPPVKDNTDQLTPAHFVMYRKLLARLPGARSGQFDRKWRTDVLVRPACHGADADEQRPAGPYGCLMYTTHYIMYIEHYTMNNRLHPSRLGPGRIRVQLGKNPGLPPPSVQPSSTYLASGFVGAGPFLLT